MRNLVMELGRTGTVEDINEFLSFYETYRLLNPSDEEEVVNQWIAENPVIRGPLRSPLHKRKRLYRRKI